MDLHQATGKQVTLYLVLGFRFPLTDWEAGPLRCCPVLLTLAIIDYISGYVKCFLGLILHKYQRIYLCIVYISADYRLWYNLCGGDTMVDKSRYKGYTSAHNEAHKRYMEGHVEIRARVSKDERDAIQAAAHAAGQSVNAYTRQAIQERMERDKATQ